MKIYTKSGDTGQTSLVSGERVYKDNIRLDAYGGIDELNGHLGYARSLINDIQGQTSQELINYTQNELHIVQNILFNIGSYLACTNEDTLSKLTPIDETEVLFLEKAIDKISEHLPPLTQFILPYGSKVSSYFHICRTVCRRSERSIVKLQQESEINIYILHFINRLSDYLFILSRIFNIAVDGGNENSEVTWDQNPLKK